MLPVVTVMVATIRDQYFGNLKCLGDRTTRLWVSGLVLDISIRNGRTQGTTQSSYIVPLMHAIFALLIIKLVLPVERLVLNCC